MATSLTLLLNLVRQLYAPHRLQFQNNRILHNDIRDELSDDFADVNYNDRVCFSCSIFIASARL